MTCNNYLARVGGMAIVLAVGLQINLSVVAQKIDRSVLPITLPDQPAITEMDARNATTECVNDNETTFHIG